jgi:hypothetical protein
MAEKDRWLYKATMFDNGPVCDVTSPKAVNKT